MGRAAGVMVVVSGSPGAARLGGAVEGLQLGGGARVSAALRWTCGRNAWEAAVGCTATCGATLRAYGEAGGQGGLEARAQPAEPPLQVSVPKSKARQPP